MTDTRSEIPSAVGVRRVVANARKLRRTSTEVERKLWHRIRDKQIEGFRFRRQRPIGKYIVDFICLDAMLIVELDGGQHADEVEYDEKRTAFLESLGFHVLRFWNNEVIENIEGVLERVRENLLRFGANPTCSACRPLHRATVRQAASTLAETPASPLALPLAGEGTGRASAEVVAVAPSLAKRGKAGMGVRSNKAAFQKSKPDKTK
jgi:very-short-patch-repair endonuclease